MFRNLFVLSTILILTQVSSAATPQNSIFECPNAPGLSSLEMHSVLYFDPDGRILWREFMEIYSGGGRTTYQDKYLTATSDGNDLTFNWKNQMTFKGTYTPNANPSLETLTSPFLNGVCKRVDRPSAPEPINPAQGTVNVSGNGSCDAVALSDAKKRFVVQSGCNPSDVSPNRAIRSAPSAGDITASLFVSNFFCARSDSRYVYQIVADSVDSSHVCSLKLLGTQP